MQETVMPCVRMSSSIWWQLTEVLSPPFTHCPSLRSSIKSSYMAMSSAVCYNAMSPKHLTNMMYGGTRNIEISRAALVALYVVGYNLVHDLR